VFSASAVVLLLALVGVYLPAARRRPLLLLPLLFLVMLAISFPTLAVLISQASLIGLACALIAAWIAYFTARVPRSTSSTVSLPTFRSTSPRLEMSPHSAVGSALPSASSATVLRVGDREE
jgi:hypothetical protein